MELDDIMALQKTFHEQKLLCLLQKDSISMKLYDVRPPKIKMMVIVMFYCQILVRCVVIINYLVT